MGGVEVVVDYPLGLWGGTVFGLWIYKEVTFGAYVKRAAAHNTLNQDISHQAILTERQVEESSLPDFEIA